MTQPDTNTRAALVQRASWLAEWLTRQTADIEAVAELKTRLIRAQIRTEAELDKIKEQLSETDTPPPPVDTSAEDLGRLEDGQEPQ